MIFTLKVNNVPYLVLKEAGFCSYWSFLSLVHRRHLSYVLISENKKTVGVMLSVPPFLQL